MPRLRLRQDFSGLGDIPSRQDIPGPVIRPGLGLVPEWINNYTAALYPFVAGLVSEQVVPANPLRTYLLIQNKNGASDMFINFGQKATALNGLIIDPGGNFELIGGANGGAYCPSDSVWILGAAANLNGVLMEGVLPPSLPRR